MRVWCKGNDKIVLELPRLLIYFSLLKNLRAAGIDSAGYYMEERSPRL